MVQRLKLRTITAIARLRIYPSLPHLKNSVPHRRNKQIKIVDRDCRLRREMYGAQNKITNTKINKTKPITFINIVILGYKVYRVP